MAWPGSALFSPGLPAVHLMRDGGNQFFGHVQLHEESFTVSLRNANGATVFSKVLTPER
jgi:hypothetical protein